MRGRALWIMGLLLPLFGLWLWAQPPAPPTICRIKVQVEGQGTVTPDPAGALYGDTYYYSVSGEQTVHLSAQPEAGWAFSRWEYGSGIPPQQTTTSTASPLAITLSSANPDWTVTAYFVQAYTVNVSADPLEGGTVTGGGTYPAGTQVTVKATPNQCYEFVNWTENENEVSTNASYTFTVTSDRDLVAHFQKIVYTLTVNVNPSGSGTVTVSWDGNEETPTIYPATFQIPCCTTVHLSASPSPGYVFQNWSGDVPTGEAEIEIHMDGNKEVTANFLPAQLPAAPSNLTAQAGCIYVKLSWTDNSDNEQGFKIYRSEDSGPFTLLDTVGPNTTVYTDNTVQEKTLYHYRVTAYNAAGESAAASVTVATPVCAQFCWNEGVVQIGAQGSGNDQQNWFGVKPGATDCFDVGVDIEQPFPFQPPYTDVWFVLPPDCNTQAIYNKDIRASIPCDGGQIWLMKVADAGGANQVTITWDLSQANFGTCLEAVMLTDLVTNTSVNMQTKNTYTYQKQGNPEIREFAIKVMCAGIGCPVADAGPDQVVHVQSQVQLDGSGSTNATEYFWEFIEVPEGSAAQLSDPGIVNPTFTPDLCGDYVLRLWVKNGGCWDQDQVVITATNQPPVANAGPDRTISTQQLPVQVQLTGSGTDPDGDPSVSWSWHWELVEKPEGSAAQLSDPNVQNPTFQADVYGSYVFELTVDDGMPCNSESEPDQVTITVQERPFCVLDDDVEAGPANWTASGLWHITERKAHSPSHAWWFGDEKTGTYGPGPLAPSSAPVTRGGLEPKATGRVAGELVSAALPVSGGMQYTLRFWHWREVEYYSKGSYDRTQVAVRFDGGPWQTIWARDSRDPSQPGWEEVDLNITIPTDASTVQIRFLFDSVDPYYNNYSGWFIDDIRLCPTEVQPLTITTTCADLPRGYVGQRYGPIQLEAQGGIPPYTWTATGLPPGVDCSRYGLISGTPEKEGTFSVSITVTDAAGNTDNLQCTIEIFPPIPCELFSEDFTDAGDWSMTGLWHLTENVYCVQCENLTGSFAYFGNEKTCSYDTGGKVFGTLISPSIKLDPCVEKIFIGFRYFRHVERYAKGSYDRTYVQVSFDGGPWQTVWLRDSTHPSPECKEAAIGPINVPKGAKTMRISFVFDSVDRFYNNFRGWAIDNVWVKNAACVGELQGEMTALAAEPSAAPRDIAFMAVPNPVRDVHTTRFLVRGLEADLIRVEVYDLTGRLVWKAEAPGNEILWHTEDLTGLPLANGVYLYKISVKVGDTWIVSGVNKLVILR